jgi:hypothetical protein
MLGMNALMWKPNFLETHTFFVADVLQEKEYKLEVDFRGHILGAMKSFRSFKNGFNGKLMWCD